MKILKKLFIILLTSSIVIIAGVITFLWWNNYPSIALEPPPPIIHLETNNDMAIPKTLKVASYNIHFGVGLTWNRKKGLDEKSYRNRLDELANVLKDIDADIVLLQEVDFAAKRSHYIDQSLYLAQKANYSYIAKAPYLRKKFYPFLQGLHGSINHGLCILSRVPIKKNTLKVFPPNREVPFYLRWLFSAHGAQKVIAKVGTTNIMLVNVHLDPWSQKCRERAIHNITSWIKKQKLAFVLGGDFNTVPPETPKKQGLHLDDAPWFIDRKQWNIEHEKTITTVRKIKGITEAIPPKVFLKNKKAAFTFPADDPKERIDYIFGGNKTKVLYGYIYKDAKTASDHLPIVAHIRYTTLPSLTSLFFRP